METEFLEIIRPSASWENPALPPETIAALKEIVMRVQSGPVRVLFTGPPGTGKTLAAEVVSGELGTDLYRVDLSGLVKKYIGETEKNLLELFSSAESSGAALFFDEADALFGRRSEVRDSHDRYANIEASHLFQWLAEFHGVVVLAANKRETIDETMSENHALHPSDPRVSTGKEETPS